MISSSTLAIAEPKDMTDGMPYHAIAQEDPAIINMSILTFHPDGKLSIKNFTSPEEESRAIKSMAANCQSSIRK